MIEATETPVSDTKKKRGRPKLVPKNEILDRETPPEQPISVPEVEPEPQTPFDGDEFEPFPPIQPKSSFRTLSTFWNERLTPAQRRQGTVYMYRLWPKMKLVPGRGRMVNENCEKFNAEDGPLTLEAIRKRRRMGIYLLRLNQRIVKPSCEISNCEVEVQGDLGNVDDMPILDIENLDIQHPSNEEYVRILRSRGIIKASDEPAGEGAEEMAATETLGQIASTLIQDRMKQNTEQAQPVQADPVAGVMGGKLVDLLEKQINQSRPVEQQGTVLDMVESLVKIGTVMKPDKPDFAPFLASIDRTNQMVLDLKEKEVQRAQAEAERARTEALQFRSAIPQPLTFEEEMDRMDRWEKRFRRRNGEVEKTGEESEEKEKAAAASATGFLGILGSLPLLLEKGSQIFQTYTVYRYNEKLGVGQLPINPMTGQADGQPAQPPVTVPQGPQSQPQESNEMQSAMQDILNKVETLRPFLLTAIRNQKPGGQLAKQLIEMAGEEAFEDLKVISITINGPNGPQQAIGKDAVWALCTNIPAIWDAEIAPGVKVNQQQHRLAQFLNEFFAYSPVAVN